MARFRTGAKTSWETALLEIEHQAEHWDTPDHGETGHLIAQALLAAVDIARAGGLQCEHRQDAVGESRPDERRCLRQGALPNASRPPQAPVPADFAGLPRAGLGGALRSWLGRPFQPRRADHWDTPDHGVAGHFVAEARRATVRIASASGLRWEHRATNATSSSPGLSSPVGWRCTFEGRAGGQAHATFASVEQAKLFAELHAHASGTSGEWVEADGSWVLRTPPGDYLVRWK